MGKSAPIDDMRRSMINHVIESIGIYRKSTGNLSIEEVLVLVNKVSVLIENEMWGTDKYCWINALDSSCYLLSIPT